VSSTGRRCSVRDTRLFKLTYKSGDVKYGGRAMASLTAAYSKPKVTRWPKGGGIKIIEATNAEATSGWTDVTAEFVSG
jgi:hypothetical protein